MKHKKNIIILIFIVYFIPSAFGQTYSDYSQDSLKNWIEKRMSNANNGINEKVEMPFVVRSLGWGCLCPDYYIGISPNTQEGPWISPVLPKDFPGSDRSGHSLVVIGYFTGKWIEEDYRNEAGEPEEWLYRMPEFKILSWRKNELEYEIHPPRIVK